MSLTPDERGTLNPDHPGDAALIALLATMAVSDDTVDEAELAFLQRILPGREREAMIAWAREAGGAKGRPSADEVAAAVVAPEERWRALRFVARMAWKDGTVAPSETALLESLASAFRFPPGAVGRVLREMRPVEGIDAAQVRAALDEVRWSAAQFAEGMLCSPDLLGVLPEGAVVVTRVGLDMVELMGLCTTGVVARFQEGPAFLPWADIVTTTRSLGLGDALRLHMEDGSSYGLVDSRLSGLSLVIDRLRGGSDPKRSSGVTVTRVG